LQPGINSYNEDFVIFYNLLMVKASFFWLKNRSFRRIEAAQIHYPFPKKPAHREGPLTSGLCLLGEWDPSRRVSDVMKQARGIAQPRNSTAQNLEMQLDTFCRLLQLIFSPDISV